MKKFLKVSVMAMVAMFAMATYARMSILPPHRGDDELYLFSL